MQQTVVWNQKIEKFKALGYELATITKDSADTLGKFAARRNIGLTLLSDPDSKVITAFGVRDDQYGTTGPYSAIARPTVFVVNAAGKIVYRKDVNHHRGPPIDEVMAALQGS